MMPRTPGRAACSQLAASLLARCQALHRHLLMRGHGIRPVFRHGFLRPGRRAGQCLPQPWVEIAGRQRIRFDALLGSRMTWVAVGAGNQPGRIDSAAIAPDDTVLVENRDFRDPHRVLQRSLGTRSVVLVRPDRVIHSHSRSRGTNKPPARRSPCRTHAEVDRRVAAAVA